MAFGKSPLKENELPTMDLKLSPLSVLQQLVFGDKNTRSAQVSMEIVNLTPFTVIHMEMWTY